MALTWAQRQDRPPVSGRVRHGRLSRSVMKNVLRRFVREDEGQDLIEYGLLIGIITVVCIVAISSIGPKVAAYFTTLDGALK
jgi:Flp pilus assembly pilin Flp